MPPETDERFFSSMTMQIESRREKLPSVTTIRGLMTIFAIGDTT
jgi:hypothetical protein